MLDIYDINYEYCSEKLGILNLPPSNLPRKGIIYRILSQIKGVLRYGAQAKTKNKIDKKSILFFVMSQNEINSVKPITLELSESSLFGLDDHKNGYPLFKIYLYSLFFIPVVFYRYLICKNTYHKKSFSYTFDGFCIAYASKYVLKKYLSEVQPVKIIIANQLSFFHRSLAYAARDLNLETIYIQHASVTENFADLNVFSKALLEGRDSLQKYQRNGTLQKDLYLIGMPKFDRYFSEIKNIEKISSIGICTNGMDDFDSFCKLITLLKQRLPDIDIIVRPHPADRRKSEWFELANENGCQFSDVSKVESFVFFKDISLLIAGDSNIHLEAALLNISSIYFDPLDQKIDWYGFSANQLIYYATNPEDVYKYILFVSNEIPDARSKAKFYIDTVNSTYDGNSSKLAAGIIRGTEIDHFSNVETDLNKNKIYSMK